jgi:hypothetical protein
LTPLFPESAAEIFNKLGCRTGQTREGALSAAQALALRVLADRLERGEALPEPLEVAFVIAA